MRAISLALYPLQMQIMCSYELYFESSRSSSGRAAPWAGLGASPGREVELTEASETMRLSTARAGRWRLKSLPQAQLKVIGHH